MTTRLPDEGQLQQLLGELQEKPQTPAVEQAVAKVEEQLEQLPR